VQDRGFIRFCWADVTQCYNLRYRQHPVKFLYNTYGPVTAASATSRIELCFNFVLFWRPYWLYFSDILCSLWLSIFFLTVLLIFNLSGLVYKRNPSIFVRSIVRLSEAEYVQSLRVFFSCFIIYTYVFKFNVFYNHIYIIIYPHDILINQSNVFIWHPIYSTIVVTLHTYGPLVLPSFFTSFLFEFISSNSVIFPLICNSIVRHLTVCSPLSFFLFSIFFPFTLQYSTFFFLPSPLSFFHSGF
jgi:hypothetical protein